MKKNCETCIHSHIELNMSHMRWKCDKGLLYPDFPCTNWEEDRPHVERETKPPIGCSPYYVNISERICELCESIKRYSTERGKHNQIKLWATEILYLNEMDRSLDRVSKEKTWVENKDGTLREVE